MDTFSFVKYDFMQSIILCNCPKQLNNWPIAAVSLISESSQEQARRFVIFLTIDIDNWIDQSDGINIADVC